MANKFASTVKHARLGINLSKKIKNSLWISLLVMALLIFGSAFFVWWKEKGFKGAYLDSIWDILFTLIGQGEFATSPQTLLGRIIVFFVSIIGVALLGVVFANLMQKFIDSRLKQIVGDFLGMNMCKFEGHIVICGWNGRGPYLIRQLHAANRQMSLIASERPDALNNSEIFFIQGNPSERETLIQAGIEKARAAIILGDPHFGNDDSHTILTGLALEAVNPNVYTVMELHDPENERYARYAHVDDILYTDSLIADITAMCTHNEGISAFIRDILSTADEGHSFASFDAPRDFRGKTIGELFAHFRAEGALPVGVITPPDNGQNPRDIPASEWLSKVAPSPNDTVTLPMKVVCIIRDDFKKRG